VASPRDRYLEALRVLVAVSAWRLAALAARILSATPGDGAE